MFVRVLHRYAGQATRQMFCMMTFQIPYFNISGQISTSLNNNAHTHTQHCQAHNACIDDPHSKCVKWPLSRNEFRKRSPNYV